MKKDNKNMKRDEDCELSTKVSREGKLLINVVPMCGVLYIYMGNR